MTDRRRSTGSFEVERTTGSHEVLDRLFVYGTMRQGQTARSLIANQIARCEGARAVGAIYGFPMGYPGFVEGEGQTIGEVLWLTELPATFALLDAYEGADFARVILQVTLDTERRSGRGSTRSPIRPQSVSGRASSMATGFGTGPNRPSSDEEVTEDRHRQGGEGGRDRRQADLLRGY